MNSRRTNRSRAWSTALASLAMTLLVGSAAFASLSAAPQAKKANRYIGAAKCKNCHSSAETGNQFEALSKMKHAHAWESLATEEAKKLAAAKGIDDPQKADACVKCHQTAFGVPDKEIAKGFDKTIGIQCESCHGPGEAHMKARMAAAANEDPNAPKVYAAVPAGEIVVHTSLETCAGCHNPESPSFKPFCYCKAKLQVRHLNPLRQRSDAEKAELSKCPCPADCGCHSECCKDGAVCSELGKLGH